MSKEIDKIIAELSHYYRRKKRYGRDIPDIMHNLVYDSPRETLEPIYFWILDFVGKIGYDIEKVADNFASSPGSGHFSELGTKKTQMQEQASRILGTINNILRSVLNIIYDLKEFKIRISHYDSANSKDSATAEAGILSLKQIWMDKVDILRGQGSINALASGQLEFVTLRDAFLAAKSPSDVDKMDLNDRVKRLLKPRILEFIEWRKRSEQELKKRFEVEKSYLKSQVDSLKLQSRWAKPYLRAAEKLEEDENLSKDAALVTAFNTVLLQMTLLAKKQIKVESAATPSRAEELRLPETFKKIEKKIRKYYSVLVIDFIFRGIPQKLGQHYVFGGRADIKFKSYGLNEDEIEMLKLKLNESDLYNALRLVEGVTEESLNQLKLDIDEFIGDKEEKSVGVSPFSALFSMFSAKKSEEKSKNKTEILKEKGIKKDSYVEGYVRNVAIADAVNNGFNVYDIFKKSMGMASPNYGGEKGIPLPPQTIAEQLFGIKPIFRKAPF